MTKIFNLQWNNTYEQKKMHYFSKPTFILDTGTQVYDY